MQLHFNNVATKSNQVIHLQSKTQRHNSYLEHTNSSESNAAETWNRSINYKRFPARKITNILLLNHHTEHSAARMTLGKQDT